MQIFLSLEILSALALNRDERREFFQKKKYISLDNILKHSTTYAFRLSIQIMQLKLGFPSLSETFFSEREFFLLTNSLRLPLVTNCHFQFRTRSNSDSIESGAVSETFPRLPTRSVNSSLWHNSASFDYIPLYFER